ncbi:MAG: glutamate racemase [Gammaproteobacteria bacterium]|nr:glutamate racemase [Gammaproteobacteria bacterium]
MSQNDSTANAPILLIDSGSGGYSILNAIHAHLGRLPFSYIADYAGQPYGLKSADELIERVVGLVKDAMLVREHSAIVVACNTASTVCLPALRAEVDVPVVGVVPAIKPACEQFPSGRVLLLATPATVKGEYLDRLIAEFGAQCEVDRFGSAELVELAERWLRGESVDAEVATLIDRNALSGYDAVVLGCTHFPLLGDIFHQHWPTTQLVDSASAIARRLGTLLSGDYGAADSIIYETVSKATPDRVRGWYPEARVIDWSEV